MSLFDLLVANTIAVLETRGEKRQEWRAALVQMRGQATEQGMCDLIALFDAVIGLVDARGNPAGLG